MACLVDLGACSYLLPYRYEKQDGSCAQLAMGFCIRASFCAFDHAKRDVEGVGLKQISLKLTRCCRMAVRCPFLRSLMAPRVFSHCTDAWGQAHLVRCSKRRSYRRWLHSSRGGGLTAAATVKPPCANRSSRQRHSRNRSRRARPTERGRFRTGRVKPDLRSMGAGTQRH